MQWEAKASTMTAPFIERGRYNMVHEEAFQDGPNDTPSSGVDEAAELEAMGCTTSPRHHL